MRIALKSTQLGLRNSRTRIPFRYGNACLTHCPQAVLAVNIEIDGRQPQRGYSGDCLPPSWFDKSPGKTFRQQIDEMLQVIALAEKTFLEEFASPTRFFPAWQIAYERIHSRSAEWEFTPLVTSFAISLLERAIIDAMARAAGMSFFQAVREDLYHIRPADVHQQLGADLRVADCLPVAPRDSLFVRHTVGLGDPLTLADIPDDERLDDGLPQSLEQYIQQTAVRYFKIKVANRHDDDLNRLQAIAALVERERGDNYKITLDGNEQYKTASNFQDLIHAIQDCEALETLWANTLAIEQPLERGIALDPQHARGIRELATQKSVIIDESDGKLDSYRQAVDVGYRGVSSKNCKGPIKSLLNACLTWTYNQRGNTQDYIMTGEDLCSVGIIPVQSDMCLVAALGLDHIERNGHHYHWGLSYLPEAARKAALVEHGDLYVEHNGMVVPRLVDGRFEIRSLQCTGFGFAVEPDLDSMQSAQQWSFDSLGLANE